MEKALSFDPSIEDFWCLETIGTADNPRQSYDERAVNIFPKQ